MADTPFDEEAYLRAKREGHEETTRIKHMRQEQADEKLAEELSEKVQREWGEDKACPYCGTNQWKVGLRILGIPYLRGEGVLPTFQVTCRNCGNTSFIDASTVDLWPEGVERSEDEGQ